jgi:NAD+ synthase
MYGNFAAEKRLSHFADPASVCQISDEIRGRHGKSYQALLNHLVGEISKYYLNLSEGENKGKHKPKFIIGLSGGIDSTVVTYLAARAVGPENVLPITMPAREDEIESLRNAELVRSNLGIDEQDFPFVIPIGNIIKEQLGTINSLGYGDITIETSLAAQSLDDKIRFGNFAARTRVAIIYDLARHLNGRVLGAGNKTEFVQGFAAKYGTPFSCDYNILYELYKLDVFELANLLNVPKKIIDSTPTTGYYQGQTHEAELGASLEEQDALAFLLFEKQVDAKSIIWKYGVNPDFVELMISRYERSLHKRMLQQDYVKIEY